jgi:hypothetical protein
MFLFVMPIDFEKHIFVGVFYTILNASCQLIVNHVLGVKEVIGNHKSIYRRTDNVMARRKKKRKRQTILNNPNVDSHVPLIYFSEHKINVFVAQYLIAVWCFVEHCLFFPLFY